MEFRNDENLTIARLAPLIRRRKVSPVELTRWILSRIERLQPTLNAYITVTSSAALRSAQLAEKEIARGRYRGPLHGIPIGLKDLIYTRGVRTTAGSAILRGFVPDRSADVADQLRSAGAVLIGKMNLHEFAYGATNVNMHYGAVRNPWNPERMSGGSSGGTAAGVSAALALAGIGTDTGGSIRIPAAACGCVGFKPSYGRVSLSGVIPLAPSLDHVGPICRCVEDAALLYNAILLTGPQGPAHSSGVSVSRMRRGIRGIRIGIPQQYFFDRIQNDVRKRVLHSICALEKSGCRIREVTLKGMRETSELAGKITVAEALAYHQRWLDGRPGDYDPAIRERMEAGRDMTAVDYVRALNRRRSYSELFEKAMESVDLVAVPTLPVVAPRIQDSEVYVGRGLEDVRVALLRLTRPGNLTGLPSISVPCGFSRDNLPVGLQLIGKMWNEERLLSVAYVFEQATCWHCLFPPDPSGT